MAKQLQSGFVSARRLDEVFSAHLYDGVNTEMDVDGSASAGPINFRHTVPANEVHFLYEVVVHLLDGTVKLDQFGGLAVLGNGIEVGFYNSDDELIIDPTDAHPIVMLSDFSIFSGSSVEAFTGNTNDVFEATWDVPESYGGSLRMEEGSYLQFKIQDDLTELTEFHVFVHGSKIVNSS